MLFSVSGAIAAASTELNADKSLTQGGEDKVARNGGPSATEAWSQPCNGNH